MGKEIVLKPFNAFGENGEPYIEEPIRAFIIDQAQSLAEDEGLSPSILLEDGIDELTSAIRFIAACDEDQYQITIKPKADDTTNNHGQNI